MKFAAIVLSAAALIALAVSPAPAASRKHVRHHHHAHYVYGGYRPLNAGGVFSGGPIYQQGYYLGTDPDPNVRFEINRDPFFGRK